MLPFWNNVRSELEHKGITQKELAASIDESYNTLQSWINKDRLPNVIQAVKIAMTLGKHAVVKPDNSETILLLEKAIMNLKYQTM